jgi:hypothetical protein
MFNSFNKSPFNQWNLDEVQDSYQSYVRQAIGACQSQLKWIGGGTQILERSDRVINATCRKTEAKELNHE